MPAAQLLALALQHAFGACGINIRKNNVAVAEQEVWHMHLHVIPRFKDDQFPNRCPEAMVFQGRLILARKIKVALEKVGHDGGVKIGE